MKQHTPILAIATATLLVGASLLPAAAIEVNVGGTSATVTTGGGNVAGAGASTGQADGANVDLILTNRDGNLVDLQNDDDTTTGTVHLGGVADDATGGGTGVGDLDGDVDIGGLIDGLLPDGAGGSTTVSETQIAAAFGGLGAGEQMMLRTRCQSVMLNPAAFDPSLVALCRVVVKIALN